MNDVFTVDRKVLRRIEGGALLMGIRFDKFIVLVVNEERRADVPKNSENELFVGRPWGQDLV
jgi:hypothetical protein